VLGPEPLANLDELPPLDWPLLDRYLAVGRRLFLSDIVFGLHAAWRSERLEPLARLDLGMRKIWALSRAELLGPGDVERCQRANVALGFGPESGDPRMLGLIGKARAVVASRRAPSPSATRPGEGG